MIFIYSRKAGALAALRPEHLFIFWCLHTPLLVLNLPPQCWQTKCLISLWTDSLCFINPFLSLKAKLHWSQGNGLTPVWSIMCLCNCCLHLNSFPQVSHLKWVASLWTFLWSNILAFRANPRPQKSHTQGFSPVWVILCMSNWALQTKLKQKICKCCLIILLSTFSDTYHMANLCFHYCATVSCELLHWIALGNLFHKCHRCKVFLLCEA